MKSLLDQGLSWQERRGKWREVGRSPPLPPGDQSPTAAQRTRDPDYGLFKEFWRTVWCGLVVEVSYRLALG